MPATTRSSTSHNTHRQVLAAAALRRLSPNEESEEKDDEDFDSSQPANADDALPSLPLQQEYTEQERLEDDEAEREYWDPIVHDFATEDPIEFNGRIYERTSIHNWLGCAESDDDSDGKRKSDALLLVDPATGKRLKLDRDNVYKEVNPKLKEEIRQLAERYESRTDRRVRYREEQQQRHAEAARQVMNFKELIHYCSVLLYLMLLSVQLSCLLVL